MFSNNGGQGNQSHVYQIDFTAVASGKRIASSKRRVRWRFGFANLDALAAGQTGTECRGEEHDVTIIWSVTSGKRLVLADGKEVHNAKNRNNVFEFSWTMKGNHVLKVVAHAQPPMTAVPGFRQYDFFVDGQSFFTFPKVFRLGLAPNDPRAGGRRRQQQDYNMAEHNVDPSGFSNGYSSSGTHDPNLSPYVNGGDGEVRSIRSANTNNIVSIEAPHNPEEEDAYLRQAIENSLKEAPTSNHPAPTPSEDNFLLDFVSPASVSAPASVPMLPPSSSQYPNDMNGAQPGHQQSAFAALPPSTTATTNPMYANSPQLLSQEQQTTVGGTGNPWGMATMAATLPPTQTSVAQPAPNPYDAFAHAPLPTQPDAVGGVAPQLASNQNPYGVSTPPTQAGAVSTQYGIEPALFGSPPPSTINKEEFTPATQASSIGFASPMAQPFRPQDDQQPPPQKLRSEQQDQHQALEPVEPVATPPSDPALLSMNVLSGQPQPLVTESMTNGANGASAGSMADQAYAKLVNMDAFDLVQSKDNESRKNPFDAAISTLSTIGGGNGNASLADMKKAKKPSEVMKSIMNTPTLAAGAIVLSNNQQGNFGGYGGLGGMNMMGQQRPNTGQEPAHPQIQGFGVMHQHPAYGQPTQQSYSMQPQVPIQQQPVYGTQSQQQGQYGQLQPMQQQQTYGQQPPPLQQPFGF